MIRHGAESSVLGFEKEKTMRLSDFLRALFVRDVVKDSAVANQAGRQHGVAQSLMRTAMG